MNKLKFIFSRILLGFFILYGYNMIAVNFNLVMPINAFTVGSISFLGAPGLIALVVFKILIL